MATTLVTAFYPIRSKFSTEQYLEWAQRFMQLNAPIVLFTEPHLVDQFRAMRPFLPLHVVAQPFEKLYMWNQYADEWRKQHTVDHEAAYHTPELYAIWAQKSVFVEQAIAENPFNTEYFYWCDIGAFRDPAVSAQILTQFPKSSLLKIVSPAILLNSVAPLTDAEKRHRDFRHVNRIVGGLWGGSAIACMRWRAAYETQLIQYFATGRFAGKDQSVMLSAYLDNPSLAAIARATTTDGDGWFFQQWLLTDQAPFEQDRSYFAIVGPPPPPPVTVRLMGGLGNQMFQIATAYAYARQHGARLVLPVRKDEEDGRPLYWSTAFQRFQHFCPKLPSYVVPPVIKPAHWESGATVWGPIPAPSSLGMRLQGYFQSPKYFKGLAAELRRLFAPPAAVLGHIEAEYRDLLEMRDRVVVVHVRRGDYLKAVEHHGVLPVEYYRAAMDRMAQKVANPFFLLVAEEPLWFMEVMGDLPALQTHPFQILMEQDEVVTMGLLQQFRHFVIANSSFSWWAAWLAAGACVIAPRQWFGPAGPKQWEDIYEDGWELM